jgi:taurine transport system permease protein
MAMRISRRLVLGAATVCLLLIAWALLTMVTGTISTGRFPSPLQFWQSAKQILTVGYADGTLIQHALHSLKLVIMGFLVAIAVGVPLGTSSARRFAREPRGSNVEG